MKKVTYSKWAKMPDGTIGNIKLGSDVCYTDLPIKDIEDKINSHLLESKRLCFIDEIIAIEGHLIADNTKDTDEQS